MLPLTGYERSGAAAMADDDKLKLQCEFHELKGAYDILLILREEFEQWLGEAEDASKKEELENVVSHVEAMEDEYKERYKALEEKLARA